MKVVPEGETTPWGEAPAQVTVTLSNVVFTGDDGCTSTNTSYTWTDVYVGWMPG